MVGSESSPALAYSVGGLRRCRGSPSWQSGAAAKRCGWCSATHARRKEGARESTSTDIILMGALLAQPLSSAPDWDAIARRQAAIYVAGLRPADGPPLPGHALTRAVLEQSFTQSSRNRPR